MATVRLAPQAAEDIDEIGEYIARHNTVAARRTLQRLAAVFQRLASFPEAGQNREDLDPGLRFLPLNNYLVFYRQVTSGIEIVRVLHGAREITSDLFFRG